MKTFEEWVHSQGGPQKVAALLDTTYTSVYDWMKGHHAPSGPFLLKILKMTKGRVNLEVFSKKLGRRVDE